MKFGHGINYFFSFVIKLLYNSLRIWWFRWKIRVFRWAWIAAIDLIIQGLARVSARSLSRFLYIFEAFKRHFLSYIATANRSNRSRFGIYLQGRSTFFLFTGICTVVAIPSSQIVGNCIMCHIGFFWHDRLIFGRNCIVYAIILLVICCIRAYIALFYIWIKT